jgi:hypothetical protein
MQVWPKNEEMRKILRHPNGVGFHPEGSVEWPDDTFTYRRITDGDVTTEAPAAAPEAAAPAAEAPAAETPPEKKSRAKASE